MTNEVIVAIYDANDQALRAVRDLRRAGVPASSVSLHADRAGVEGPDTAVLPPRGARFWTGLLGGELEYPNEPRVYDLCLLRGSTVVTARLPAPQPAAVVDILLRHNPVDIDDRSASYNLAWDRSAGTNLSSAFAGDVEASTDGEDRWAARRLVNRGSPRVRRFVVATSARSTPPDQQDGQAARRRMDSVFGADAFAERVIAVTEGADDSAAEKRGLVRRRQAGRANGVQRPGSP